MADEQVEFAGLHDALLLAVHEGEVLPPQPEGDGLRFAGGEEHLFKALQLADGAEHGAFLIAHVLSVLL